MIFQSHRAFFIVIPNEKKNCFIRGSTTSAHNHRLSTREDTAQQRPRNKTACATTAVIRTRYVQWDFTITSQDPAQPLDTRALDCEGYWVTSTHDVYDNTCMKIRGKCGELKLYLAPSAGG